MTKKLCESCGGTGWYQYDDMHSKVCEFCCTHLQGWWKLDGHYGSDNGKYCCKAGCGTVIDKIPDQQIAIK